MLISEIQPLCKKNHKSASRAGNTKPKHIARKRICHLEHDSKCFGKRQHQRDSRVSQFYWSMANVNDSRKYRIYKRRTAVSRPWRVFLEYQLRSLCSTHTLTYKHRHTRTHTHTIAVQALLTSSS